MMANSKRTLCAIWLLGLLCLLYTPSQAASKCADLFKTLFDAYSTTLKFPGINVEVTELDATRINEIKENFVKSAILHTVLYIPVKTKIGYLNIRIEKNGAGAISESVYGANGLSISECEKLLTKAKSMTSFAARKELYDTLMPPKEEVDAGKEIFFYDLYYNGLLPYLFSKENAILLGTTNFSKGYENYTALQTKKGSAEDYSAFIGYPESETGLQQMRGSDKQSELSQWRDSLNSITEILSEYGVPQYDQQYFAKCKGIERILRQMTESKGIIFVVAHADGCKVHLPGGDDLTLTPELIEKLELKNNPFVVVRICNGIENGYAKAFIKAGASGVWINQQTSTGEQANQDIGLFLKTINEGLSIYDAIKELEKSHSRFHFRTGLVVTNERRNDEQYSSIITK